MKIIEYFSNLAIPLIILIILLFGIIEKKNVFDIFLDGAKEGINIAISIFPTLVGLFVAIGALRCSGILDFLINLISPFLGILRVPQEIVPLALLRPISGSASIAIGTDIMKQYGVDSKIGLIVSTIMGSTETTLYTIAIYSSSIGIKKTRFVLWAALIGDLVRNYSFCRNLADFVVKKQLTKTGKYCKI